MISNDVSRDDIQACIAQLEQAMYNHSQWYNNLIRTLACRITPDDHDIHAESYKQCRFGQWLYSDEIPEGLREHPALHAIVEEHEHMHKLCTQLLFESMDGSIKPMDYDKFANALERLRLEISAFKRELEDTLYNHDPLTGAINRVSMLPILREQQELIKRDKQVCCIAMMDIDDFKLINDKHGHVVGDHVLVEVTRHAFKHTRPYDKIFRYGGEEFLFCMPHTDMELGKQMMERLRREISNLKIRVDHQQALSATVSLGLALLNPATSIEESIDCADKALYQAKTNGKNCVSVYE
jgi:diguanylate cyclase (GGDEF)-like protein